MAQHRNAPARLRPGSLDEFVVAQGPVLPDELALDLTVEDRLAGLTEGQEPAVANRLIAIGRRVQNARRQILFGLVDDRVEHMMSHVLHLLEELPVRRRELWHDVVDQ